MHKNRSFNNLVGSPVVAGGKNNNNIPQTTVMLKGKLIELSAKRQMQSARSKVPDTTTTTPTY